MIRKNCGQPMNDNREICLNCGVKIAGGSGDCLNGRDKATVALICCFLDFLGIRSFMPGETKKGVFRIIMSFVCGIGGLLALYDFIMILMDKYAVDPNKLI